MHFSKERKQGWKGGFALDKNYWFPEDGMPNFGSPEQSGLNEGI
jgi:hypothetical protein